MLLRLVAISIDWFIRYCSIYANNVSFFSTDAAQLHAFLALESAKLISVADTFDLLVDEDICPAIPPTYFVPDLAP